MLGPKIRCLNLDYHPRAYSPEHLVAYRLDKRCSFQHQLRRCENVDWGACHLILSSMVKTYFREDHFKGGRSC